ncbi:WbqC family protein, partial [Pseudomonas viridiflava]|uniref:WbqC family protein n=1 Tax=Pseudomonas viridiflava TaxID=33069 RepID=UPI0013D1846C
LRFYSTHPVTYPQLRQPFVIDLSIIDVLIFNTLEQVQALLSQCTTHDLQVANDPFVRIGQDPTLAPSSQLAAE